MILIRYEILKSSQVHRKEASNNNPIDKKRNAETA